MNDKALEREIIMHGADYVSEAFIAEHGAWAQLGCPAVPRERMQRLVTLLADGGLLLCTGLIPVACHAPLPCLTSCCAPASWPHAPAPPAQPGPEEQAQAVNEVFETPRSTVRAPWTALDVSAPSWTVIRSTRPTRSASGASMSGAACSSPGSSGTIP